jgi:hypothetical protein
LIANKDGETFYLEVEIGAEADRSSLVHKWENPLLIGAGRNCVVTRRFGTMNNPQSQIIVWASENGKKCHLLITCIGILKKTELGESPWARDREL